MNIDFNPVSIINQVVDWLYPNLNITLIFASGMYDEEGVFSKLLYMDEDVPAKIMIDYDVPVGSVPAEVAEQVALLLVQIYEDDDDENVYSIASYIYERYKLEVIEHQNSHLSVTYH